MKTVLTLSKFYRYLRSCIVTNSKLLLSFNEIYMIDFLNDSKSHYLRALCVLMLGGTSVRKLKQKRTP